MNDKDLLGKADGLMRRNPPALGTETVPVPVLTDFVEAPPPGPPVEVAHAPSPPPAASEHDEIAAQVTRRVEQRLEEEMQRVRRELAQAVADAVREALATRPVK